MRDRLPVVQSYLEALDLLCTYMENAYVGGQLDRKINANNTSFQRSLGGPLGSWCTELFAALGFTYEASSGLYSPPAVHAVEFYVNVVMELKVELWSMLQQYPELKPTMRNGNVLFEDALRYLKSALGVECT